MADQAGIINSTTGAIVPVNNALVETSPGVWSLQATAPGYVPESRTISTTAPLTGGGDLSANRTIAMPAATGAADGYMTAARAGIVDAFTAFGRSLGAAVDAAAAKLLLLLTKSDVGLGNVDNTSDANKPVSTAQATADGLRVLKAGDTMTGKLILSNGANLTISGADALGEGNIVMAAAASAAFDTNLVISDSTAKTMGFICGATPGFVGVNGPFFGLRGNTYSAYANQRGNIFLYGGRPSAPGSTEGRVAFGTNDQERLGIDYNGTVKVPVAIMLGAGTALTKAVVYTPSLTPASVSAGAGVEQTFAVSGLTTGDTVTVNAPAGAVFSARVTAANTLGITFMPPASGSYTPPTGTYRVLAIRS